VGTIPYLCYFFIQCKERAVKKEEAAVLRAARKFAWSSTDSNAEKLKRAVAKMERPSNIATNIAVGAMLVGLCIVIGIGTVTR
jgi:hypothetical protein